MRDAVHTDRYLPFLRRLLTPLRLQHSIGVMQVMAELAEIYALDRAQAMATGLLHDAARDLSNERQLALIEEAGIQLSYPYEQHPIYLHALAGTHLVAKELGIADCGILDAIAVHSYAGNRPSFNAPLSQCLRFADILAPCYEWKGMKKLKSVVYAGRMEEGALLQCGWLIEYFEEQGVPVHANLVGSHLALLDKVAMTESFFERW